MKGRQGRRYGVEVSGDQVHAGRLIQQLSALPPDPPRRWERETDQKRILGAEMALLAIANGYNVGERVLRAIAMKALEPEREPLLEDWAKLPTTEEERIKELTVALAFCVKVLNSAPAVWSKNGERRKAWHVYEKDEAIAIAREALGEAGQQ